jgi:hypothetical protein
LAAPHRAAEVAAFAGTFSAGAESHKLLAMQKVEGSNPFSRFQEGLHLQVFFVGAVAKCVCVLSD